MPIRNIENVRDLLIHICGETLGRARESGRLHEAYPDLNGDEAAVAHILDGITRRSLQGLLDLRERQGWKE